MSLTCIIDLKNNKITFSNDQQINLIFACLTLPVPLRLAPVSVAHCGGDGGGSSKSNASREEDDNGEGEDDKNEDKDEELPLFQASTAMGITATGQCLHAL